jgi:adenylate kinase family enzyme
MHANVKKILVIGCSGGGKSTLTRALSEKLNLPPIHLDMHFWQPNWTETPADEWHKKISKLIKADKWVMDGTFSSSFNLRFPVADKIIFLNLPTILCLWRAITRVFKYSRKSSRPDMALGCHEKMDLDFYKYIWTFKRKINPQIEEAIIKHDCRSKVVELNSDSEVKNFLKSLQNSV